MVRTSSAIAKPIEYDDALITSVIPYADTDCIVRLFARGRGRMVAFCRGGRAFKKNNNAPCAPALARVGLVQGGHKLTRLVTCELDLGAIMPTTPRIFGLRVYIAELIEKLLPEEDAAEDIFIIVEEVFAALAEPTSSGVALRAFELKLLEYCGYLPEMPTEEQENAVVGFDPSASRFTTSLHEDYFAFSPSAVRLAKTMLIAKIGGVNYEYDDELMMIGRIFQSRLKVMGLFPLKSVAFLKQLSGRERNGE